MQSFCRIFCSLVTQIDININTGDIAKNSSPKFEDRIPRSVLILGSWIPNSVYLTEYSVQLRRGT